MVRKVCRGGAGEGDCVQWIPDIEKTLFSTKGSVQALNWQRP